MKNISKKTIGLLLVIVLCFSMMPITAMATSIEPMPESTGQSPDEIITEIVTATENEATGGSSNSLPGEPGDPALEVQSSEVSEAALDSLADDTPAIEVEPELVKVVDKPLVQVVYHYYAADQNQNVGSFADYTIASTHSYNALAMANGDDITIAANMYPDKVPVSTDALRFQVLLNGNEDITAQASYDLATGLVSLSSDFMGHNITVHWYCPASEVTELAVTATISVYQNGKFTTTTEAVTTASNASALAVPLAVSGNLVVSQNGIDLDESAYSVDGGTLHVSASALGGDIAITAYAPTMRAMSGGMSAMGTSATTVVHTRSSDQIFYGYYTSYYTANGNTAFCLDPTVSGLNSGTYDVSGWLERGTGYDDLIKAAWYLYGGPGYNSVKNNLFGNPDSMTAYGLCHAAAAYMWLDNAEAFKGLDSATTQHLHNLIAAINAQAMPPEGFNVFLYNVGSSTNQSLMGWDYTPTGDLAIVKTSNDPAKTDDNDCYSLEGAVFDVYNGSDVKVGTITTDKDGKGKLEGLATGTGYYIMEVSPPKGYVIKDEGKKISFEITSGNTATVEVENIAQGDPVTILLKKQDADTNTGTPQGGASLKNAQFTIRYYKGHYTENELKNVSPARSWVVATDEDGFAMLHPDYKVSGDELYYDSTGKIVTLPLGTVTIQESKAPAGYLLNDTMYIRQVTTEGKREPVYTYNEPVVPDTVIRGGVEIVKLDIERNVQKLKQGNATLAGAVLEIWNRSAESVVVNDKEYAPGTVVHTMTTNADGWAGTANDLLPYGSYEVIEKTPPTGYLNTGVIKQSFQIRENGVIVNLKASEKAIRNDIIRGGVRVLKFDNEIDENRAQGGATLEGAVFEVINRSADSVLVAKKLYAPGEVVHTMTTDADGMAETSADLLPYGTYELREISPPDGYLATGVLSRTFAIRTYGKIVEMNTSETAIKNNPIRGDLKGVKISDGDANRLAGVPFMITSKTTGESHIVVTDRNGEFSTASSWNPHSQNTNRGESDRDGVWFGEMRTLDDSLGALLYDDYVIAEQPCDANDGLELLTIEVSIYRHMTVIDLGTLTDDYIQVPEIFTTALDQESTANDAHISEETTITDTVYYSGLKVGKDYTVKGILMDKEANVPLLVDGQEATAEKTFKALTESGTVTMEFTFNSAALKGRSVVVFETLYHDDAEIAVHADIEDEGQTVVFHDPQIGTSATGPNDEKELDIYPETTIIDTVSFENLIVGQTYTIKGTLMDKETGEPLLVDGNPVTAEKTIISKAESGTFELEFTFSSVSLKGTTVVVFESLEYKGREIAVHADIKDEGQTVTFKNPEIKTSATGVNGEKELLAEKKATIVDVVTYDGLAAGETYVVKGVLMDKATGEPLLVDGKEISAETKFVAKGSSGSVEVVFTLNALELRGKAVVVFEALYYDDAEIAVHAEIEDDGQTVVFKDISIGTSATGEDGTKIIPVAETVKVIDVVSYQNLAPGEEYVVKGVLMDKETGKSVLASGKEITAEKAFVPKEPSGSVNVEFVFNSTALQNKILVVFESLTHEGTEVAAHADIDDDAQTVGVGVEVVTTTGTGARTGRDGLPLWLLFVAIGAAAGAFILFMKSKKKSKMEEK
ncbi:VaFE repeat-containing surface-anchored protein [Christensenellaceae bacterium OttesenSCG-928-K19]|nr:VaFE repeat-containing surface-anchored protein [Christensenellaceae bacterium OttesenSCG-928-K19]